MDEDVFDIFPGSRGFNPPHGSYLRTRRRPRIANRISEARQVLSFSSTGEREREERADSPKFVVYCTRWYFFGVPRPIECKISDK